MSRAGKIIVGSYIVFSLSIAVGVPHVAAADAPDEAQQARISALVRQRTDAMNADAEREAALDVALMRAIRRVAELEKALAERDMPKAGKSEKP